MKRDKLELGEAPPLEKSERTNTRTGEVYGSVPKGIGAGWDYNVGKAWLGPQVAFGQKLAALPPRIRADALSAGSVASISSIITPVFKAWSADVLAGKSATNIHHVGYFSDAVLKFSEGKNKKITDATISILARDLQDMTKPKSGRTVGRSRAKQPKELIPTGDLMVLPDKIVGAAALWDVKTESVVYAFDSENVARSSKVVVRQRSHKGLTKNLVIHGSVVSKESLKNAKDYILIEGDI
jgi:hypothetical protein